MASSDTVEGVLLPATPLLSPNFGASTLLAALAALLLHGSVLALLLWSSEGAAGGSGGRGGQLDSLIAVDVVLGFDDGDTPLDVGQPAAKVEPPRHIGEAAATIATGTPTPRPSLLPRRPDREPQAARAEVPPPPGPEPSPLEPAPAATTDAPTDAIAADPDSAAPLQASAPQVVEATTGEQVVQTSDAAAAPPDKPDRAVQLPDPVVQPQQSAPAADNSEMVLAEAAEARPSETGPSEVGPRADQESAEAGSDPGPSLAALPAGSGAGGAQNLHSVGSDGPLREAYLATVMQWLEGHKRYPKSAERRRQQGKVLVAFTVSANGQVAGIRLVGGSGYGALDEEALALLQRASPLPPFPRGLPAASLTLELPVDFSLR